jgi:hypothetical protein
MPPSRPIVASPKPQLLQTRLYLVGWQNAHRLGGYCRRDDTGKERSKVKFNCEALAASRPVRGSSSGLILAPREQQQVEWLDGDNARDTPPPYDGSALAQDVFSHPYFYDGEVLEVKESKHLRSRAVGKKTVRELLRGYFYEHGVEAIETLARSIQANPLRLMRYYQAEETATRQKFATRALAFKFSCELMVAAIPVSTINESLRPLLTVESKVDSQADGGLESRTIGLSFLDPLRDAEEEKFLVPDKIYVRDCMRRVFSLFHEDAVQVPRRRPSKAYSAALIGSPGVGKSILFFLAALDQACTSNVAYYRRVGAEAASVFVMTPDRDGRSVRIWFARNVENLSIEGLKDLRNALKSTCTIDITDYYTFVDGPKQFDFSNLLDGEYDYLCTSGGLRRYKNDEQDKRLWVLDGWSAEEAVRWLRSLKHTAKIAKEAYFLCGGNIRDMLKACVSPEETKLLLDKVVNEASDDLVELAVVSTERANAPNNPDRLRTMFELPGDVGDLWKKQMNAFQIVDSLYMINQLSRRLRVGPFFKAYQLALSTNTRSGQGTLFESIVHLLV